MVKKQKRKLTDNLKLTKQPRVRAEVIDYDYVDKLSQAEKEWLGKFTDEYAGASFEFSKTTGKLKKDTIHKTMEQVKACRDANNWRNNDVYGANRANGLLLDVQNNLETEDGWYVTNREYTEMEAIAKIDNKEYLEELSFIEYLECRGNMLESRQQQLDEEFRIKLNYASDNFYMLLIIYNSGQLTKGQIIKMSQNPKLLKKFIETSDLFKPKKP